jgi:hypothetical protein
MFDARRLMFDTVCVAVLALLMVWGAEAIAAVPIALPAPAPGGVAGAGSDCYTAKPKEAVAGAPPSTLNLAECGDAGAAAGTGTGKHTPKPVPPTEPGKLPH